MTIDCDTSSPFIPARMLMLFGQKMDIPAM